MSSEDIERIKQFFNEHIFKWMYEDVRTAIRCKANFLAALGLSEYTGIIGGLKTGKLLCENCCRSNYEAFLPYLEQPYVDINSKLKSKGGLYKIVRCGLAHKYFIKGPHVIMNDPKRPDDSPLLDTFDCEVLFIGEELGFIVDVYFRDFKKGIEKYYRELIDEKGLAVFRECLKAIFERQKIEGPMVWGSSGTILDLDFKDGTD